MITKYFASLKEAIAEYSHIALNYTTEEKTYSDTKGYIHGFIYFIDLSVLEFTEVKDTDEDAKIKYRYNFMSSDGLLVFRYDNAKHYPNLATFPHHKHTSDQVMAYAEPSFKQVLSEIEACIAANEKKE